MKGILLAGGYGNRLKPLTEVISKQLLHIYNKPMVYYPINTLVQAGITDIMIITGPSHAGMFLQLLGDGSKFGCNLQFRMQAKPEGIAHAVNHARDFIAGEKCCVILGDNIYEDDVSKDIEKFFNKKGGHVFLKEIENAQRFGVAELKGSKVVGVEEKPKNPKSNYAVTGLYLFDSDVFEVIAGLRPSNRGEFEITDVINEYIKKGNLTASILKRRWSDAGTFESLYNANTIARDIHFRENPPTNGALAGTRKQKSLSSSTKVGQKKTVKK